MTYPLVGTTINTPEGVGVAHEVMTKRIAAFTVSSATDVTGPRAWRDFNEAYIQTGNGMNQGFAMGVIRTTTEGVGIAHEAMTKRIAKFLAEAATTQSVPGYRIWGGIGGFLYVPSFPQLSKRETTYPKGL